MRSIRIKAIRRVPWRALLPTGFLLLSIGLAEFLYLWLGQHLSVTGFLDWLRGLVDQFLG